MEDNSDFIKDSLFCEYAYIINLDTHDLEYWRGFQEEPDPFNRYGCDVRDNYYPCKLLLKIPLNKIVTVKEVKEWISIMEDDNEEEN